MASPRFPIGPTSAGVVGLALANIAIFVVYRLMPAMVADLALSPEVEVLVDHPWQPLTYMFFHISLLHITVNILVLIVFGSVLARHVGDRNVIMIYLLGGLCGAMLYTAAFGSILGRDNILMGSSASVLSVICAAAVISPGSRVQFYPHGPGVSISFFAGVFLLLVLAGLGGNNAGGALAHIGGAMAGTILGFILKMRQQQISAQAGDWIELELLQRRISISGFSSLSESEKRRFFHLSCKTRK